MGWIKCASICGGNALYLVDNTVVCVMFILTKQRGKTSLPGGYWSMKKRRGDMHYMNRYGMLGNLYRVQLCDHGEGNGFTGEWTGSGTQGNFWK